jgi:putative redox protein
VGFGAASKPLIKEFNHLHLVHEVPLLLRGIIMETIVRYLGNTKFEAIARGHLVICDQPGENHGTDAGMSPPEFLLVSLGTCAGYYATQYLQVRGLDTKNLTVRVSAGKAARPTRLDMFVIEVEAPDVDARHYEGLLRAAKACLIHNTLNHGASVEIKVHTAEPVGV